MSANKPNKKNYIFIDFENVQPSSLNIPEHNNYKVFIFVGANQKKIPVELATSIQNLGNKAEYIIINGVGKNALDFHIAFYIGKLSVTEPTAFFHIISKDSGYDVLISHLKEKKISVYRYTSFNEIPLVKKSTFETLSVNAQISEIADYLVRRGNAKPRKVNTLANTIMSISGRTLCEERINGLINLLEQKKMITIKDKSVTYKLRNSK
ncbi:MAG: PIN domain-containing protein [Halarcobacter ebronensis]|uniref:PIN domain-containing protein n=1 Tax=Halarcobacter ebronensis TaxID=1462615 RepID=UPI003C7314F0